MNLTRFLFIQGDKPRTRYAFTLYHDNLCGGSLEIGQEMIVMGKSAARRPSKHEALAQCWADVGPAPRVFWGDILTMLDWVHNLRH